MVTLNATNRLGLLTGMVVVCYLAYPTSPTQHGNLSWNATERYSWRVGRDSSL